MITLEKFIFVEVAIFCLVASLPIAAKYKQCTNILPVYVLLNDCTHNQLNIVTKSFNFNKKEKYKNKDE